MKTTQHYLIQLDKDINHDQINDILEKVGGRITHRFGSALIAISVEKSEKEFSGMLPSGYKILKAGDDLPQDLDATTRKLARAYHASFDPQVRGAKEIRRKNLPTVKDWESDLLPVPDSYHTLEIPQYALDPEDLQKIPKNLRMINEIAVGLMLVDGNGYYELSDIEEEYIMSEVIDGLNGLAANEPNANITWNFSYDKAKIDYIPWVDANFPGLPNNFYKGFSGAMFREDVQKLSFFREDKEVKYIYNDEYKFMEAKLDIHSYWPDMPSQFYYDINAALWRHSNQQVYLFKDEQFSTFKKVDGVMKYQSTQAIKDFWPKLPESFQTGIDAALMCRTTNKIYFFKGDQYVRYSNVSSGVDKSGSIADFCSGLPESFKSGINSAVQLENGKILLFKSDFAVGRYVQISDLSAGVDPGFENGLPIGYEFDVVESKWRDPFMQKLGYQSGNEGILKRLVKVLEENGAENGFLMFFTKWPTAWGMYAAAYPLPPKVVINYTNYNPPELGGEEYIDWTVTHETAHIFFAADEYVPSNCSCSATSSGFFKVSNGNCSFCSGDLETCVMRNGTTSLCSYSKWHVGWNAFMTKIDAALWREDNQKAYLFSNSKFIQYSKIADGYDPDYPRDLAGNWPNMPEPFAEGIDAALFRHDNQKIYLFKGNKYLRYKTTNGVLTLEAERSISSGWPGLDANFQQGIDAAFWRESNGKIYFFKGANYARFTINNGTPTLDYTRAIAGNWVGLPTDFQSGVDAVLMRHDNHLIYFFKGKYYIRYSDTENKAVGEKRRIHKNWMPFPK